ncbi:Alpha/Beta hydrolase protein [Delphinella strobiligena]|nr:Alpha/Beta hydrolase protein [Delphinella strobiligena]
MECPVSELSAPSIGTNGYQGFNPRTETLPKGWNGFNWRPLECDILVEHDFAVTVRDGARLYADIYRPPNNKGKVPALICWSPFGKKFNGLMCLEKMTPYNVGIPNGTLSGLEKFEGPDPADWVPKGYAIINVDSRGAGDSDGVMAIMGTQQAEDGYDFIEAIAKLEWCDGQIGLAGNSHLAIVQWFIAALKPPSLKAIAPWEACGDLYREQFARGSIYAGDLFDNLITKFLIQGRHGIESFREMYKRHALANKWWNDKRPDMSKISIPTYMTGTWTNSMHGMGVIRGWREVATDKKWLRWHATQEWRDLWGSQQAKDELLQFFDFYLKGTQNNWEATPQVRMAILRFGESDPISNILYFSPSSQLSFTPPETSTSVSYDPHSKVEFASFTYTFQHKTQLVGMPKAVIYMSCSEHDDMDVYVTIAEIPADKRTEVGFYAGPLGILRASHHEIDASKSMHENWPFHPHERVQKVPQGEIVKLDIGIWAMGIEYEAGESIRVQISGVNQGMHFATEDFTDNKGTHVVHFGGEYDSHVILPFV